MKNETLTMAEMFTEQSNLEAALGNEPNADTAPMHLLAAVSETMEALDELNWKPWKKTKRTVDLEAYAEELTDTFQFLVNAAIALGLTEEDLTCALRDKWLINHRRITEGY